MSKAAAFGALMSLAATAAVADTGPKPTIGIAFTPDRPGVAIKAGELLECQDRRCATSHPLQRLGPQGFACQALACTGRAYGFSDWQALKLTLTDGRVLKSAPFGQAGFDSRYKARIVGGALKVAP